MINPLLICLQDRSSNVRNAAEDIIKSSLNFISINNYYKKSEDFKPAITKTLKQILDKIKKEIDSSAPQQEPNAPEQEKNKQATNIEQNSTNNKAIETNNSTSKKNLNQIMKKNEENTNNTNTNTTNTKNNAVRPVSKKNSIKLAETPATTESGIDDSEKNDSSNNLEDPSSNYNTVSNFVKNTKKPEKEKTKKTLNVKRAKPKRKLSEDDLVNPLGTAMNKQMPVPSVSHLASNSTILKKNDRRSFQKHILQQNTKTPAVFLMNVKVIPNKAKRFDKDKRTKFSLDTVSKDYFNKLKDQCKGLFVEEFSKKNF